MNLCIVCRYAIRADRIVAATYLSAVASAGGEAYLRRADPETLASVITVLRESGCEGGYMTWNAGGALDKELSK